MSTFAEVPHLPTIPTRALNQYSRITNRPRRMVVSGRTATGRRLRDLADGFAEALGGWQKIDYTTAANVRRAAELTVLAEQSRAHALRHGCNDFTGLTRLEGYAYRAVRALGLCLYDDKLRPAKPKVVPLRERLMAEVGGAP
jgi:hypothetical protein